MPHIALRTRRPRLLQVLVPALVLGGVLAAVTVFLAPAAHAAADPTCDPLVIDRADVLDDKAVRVAARKVQDEAADVRVIAYRRVPHGNLDKQMEAEQRRCDSWQGQRNSWKNNLVVLAVSVGDRRTGLYYADTFESQLGREWPRIQADMMNPRFKRDDYTGGMVAALTEVARVIDPAYTAPLPAREPRPRPEHRPRQIPVDHVEVSPPADGPGVGALVVPAGAAGVGALTWAGIATRRRLRRRSQARAAAVAARDTMADAFVALDEAREFIGARVEALPRVDDVKLNATRTLNGSVAEQIRAVMVTYVDTAETFPAESLSEMSTAEAVAAEQAMTGIAATMQTLSGDLEKVTAQLDDLESLRATLPGLVGQVRDLARQVERLLPQRTLQGFFVEGFAASLPGIEEECAEVDRLLAELRYGDAEVKANAVLTAVQTLHSTVDGLPAHQQQLRADLDALRAEESRARSALDAALAVTGTLEETRHTSCTEDVRALMTQTVAELATLPALLDDLDRSSSMKVQELDAADAAAAEARRVVAVVDENSAAPAGRRDRLDHLEATLPTVVDDVAGALARLRESVAGNATAVSYLDRPVPEDTLSHDLDDARSELEQPRPRLLVAEETLTALAATVRAEQDRVDTIVGEYAEVDRLMQLAQSAVSSASAMAGRMHAGYRARDLAADAEQLLLAAVNAADLDNRRGLAKAAAARAEEAEAAARRAIREHRQRSSFSSGGGFGGSSFGGGGGGSSFGGGGGHGGGHGGGSSSFGGGGGGGRGGGSSKF